jgi:hypothetical protein
MQIITFNHFIEKGGFFPVAVKHSDTVFVFCRAGAGHLGQTGKITVMVTSNGTDWQRRGTVSKKNTDVRNPAAFIFNDGKMLLAAYKYNVYDNNGYSAPAKYQSPHYYDTLIFSSDDGGYKWTEVKANFNKVTEKIGKVSPHGSMLLNNNLLLMPAYNKEGAFLLASKNSGIDWDIYTQIAAEMLEPYVIQTPENKLLAVMRTGRKKKWAEASVISHFTDNKWIEPEAITEPLQHPASLLSLSDGRILLTYGDRNYQHQRIMLKLSNNGGLTWGNEQQLGEQFENSDFGYPTTVEIEPGKIITVFYKNPMENPYFYFANPGFYTDANVKGYYYLYSLD